MNGSLAKLVGTTAVLAPVAFLTAMIYGYLPPDEVVNAPADSYSSDATILRVKALRAAQSTTAWTTVVPGISYRPVHGIAASQQHFTCIGLSRAAQPVGWINSEAELSLTSGERGLRQNNADLVFFDVAGGKEGRAFTNTGFCDFTVGHLADRGHEEPARTGEQDVALPVNVFRGEIPSSHRISLFNGAVQAWTSRFSQKPGHCDLRVQFNAQIGTRSLAFEARDLGVSKHTNVFYLRQNERDIYKFDMRGSPGQEIMGGCPMEVTHIRLPAVPDTPAQIFRAGTPGATSTNAGHAVGGYQVVQNVQIAFNEETRVIVSERDVPLQVAPNTKYSITRSFTAAQQISFGGARNTGVDVGSPMIAALTGGLLSAEIKNYWEGRFTQGTEQAETSGAMVEVDGSYCPNWTYSVYKTVRDGSVSARDYGLREALSFTLTERVHIEATPQCGTAVRTPRRAS